MNGTTAILPKGKGALTPKVRGFAPGTLTDALGKARRETVEPESPVMIFRK